MLNLVRFDLPCEWEQFYKLFAEYLAEVCDKDEYLENINDLQNDDLNRGLIEQMRSEHNPYFIMRIELDGKCIGLISYSYHEDRRLGFINNFYIREEYRNSGIGSAAYKIAESRLKILGANEIELIPVGKAQTFYTRNGFAPSRISAEGENVFSKKLNFEELS